MKNETIQDSASTSANPIPANSGQGGLGNSGAPTSAIPSSPASPSIVTEPTASAGEQSDTQTVLELAGRRIVIIGTAHVSADSVAEVAAVIEAEHPQVVAIELDPGRYQSMKDPEAYKRLDVYKVIKDKRGFLMLANLMLSSFQKRMGLDAGVKPGEEMREAIRVCEQKGIPFALIDREIQITLRRAWGNSGFWGKQKLLAALLASAFGSEQIDAAQIEELKKKSAMQGMMDDLAQQLPKAKTALIDERDLYLAAKLWLLPQEHVVAVVGAGHVPGMVRHLQSFASAAALPNPSASLTTLSQGSQGSQTSESGGTASSVGSSVSATQPSEAALPGQPAKSATQPKSAVPDLATLEKVPGPSIVGKILSWILPLGITALLIWGFVSQGFEQGLSTLLTWVALNGGLAALGTLIALGHPLTILAAVIGAPIATLNPLISVGFITGLVEAWLRKPRVSDLENLQTDITSFKGFWTNRVTRALLVFVLSSLGGMIGNLVFAPMFLAGR